MEKLATLCAQGQEMWIGSVPARKRPGRPVKSDIERLRVRVWYWKLKSLRPEDWTDARLDEEFTGQKGQGRLRIFERMRRKSWFPQTFDEVHNFKKLKRPEDLVELVNNHPMFAGTKDLLESPFWTIFGKQTADLTSVRRALNECLDRNGLVRLESDLNEVIDAQVRELIRQPEKRIYNVSSAGVYTQWLYWELNQIPDDFEKLTLVGLLFRESLLLAYLDSANVLSLILQQLISQISRAPWLSELREDFRRIISSYIKRGHADVSCESELYKDGSRRAVGGYIVSKGSAFLGGPEDIPEKEDWRKGLEFTCSHVDIMTRSVSAWDPNDESYGEEAYKQWLKDRQDPTIRWPECPLDENGRVPEPDEWPPGFL